MRHLNFRLHSNDFRKCLGKGTFLSRFDCIYSLGGGGGGGG